MIRRATDRLGTSVVLTVLGFLVALLAGRPEAALLVMPWAVLLTLGLANTKQGEMKVSVDVAQDRVVVGDQIDIKTTINEATGTVLVKCVSHERLWPGTKPVSAPNTQVVEPIVAGTATVHCSLEATAWGTHDLGKVQLQITEPYGLFKWSAIQNQPSMVRVHPTQVELRDLITPRLVRRITGSHLSSAVGRGVEYADIREYGPGDSLRDINWRASARSQELWVSERHPDRATDVVLFLDSFVESGHDVQKVVGMAIEAAVGLAESHLAATDRVGLVELGGIVRWVAPSTGRIQLQKLTDALLSTGLYANATERDLGVIPPRALPPRSFVVALTPLLDDRFIQALFLLAARGHDVAVVECVPDWGSFDTDLTEASKVANRMWQAERQVARDRLTDAGVSIAPWDEGTHVDLMISELTRRRQRSVRVAPR